MQDVGLLNDKLFVLEHKTDCSIVVIKVCSPATALPTSQHFQGNILSVIKSDGLDKNVDTILLAKHLKQRYLASGERLLSLIPRSSNTAERSLSAEVTQYFFKCFHSNGAT